MKKSFFLCALILSFAFCLFEDLYSARKTKKEIVFQPQTLRTTATKKLALEFGNEDIQKFKLLPEEIRERIITAFLSLKEEHNNPDGTFNTSFEIFTEKEWQNLNALLKSTSLNEETMNLLIRHAPWIFTKTGAPFVILQKRFEEMKGWKAFNQLSSDFTSQNIATKYLKNEFILTNSYGQNMGALGVFHKDKLKTLSPELSWAIILISGCELLLQKKILNMTSASSQQIKILAHSELKKDLSDFYTSLLAMEIEFQKCLENNEQNKADCLFNYKAFSSLKNFVGALVNPSRLSRWGFYDYYLQITNSLLRDKDGYFHSNKVGTKILKILFS